jgi:site-specific recombinase XerD
MDIVQAEKIFVQRMQSKNWSACTIKNYSSQLRSFLFEFKHRDRARNITAQEIEVYLLQKVKINTRKYCRCAIQAFYKLCVNQPMKLSNIPWPKKEQKLPQPIEASDIQKILSVCHNLKHRAIICLLYGCGLRISEVINLKPEHIDSQNMIINIISGKGKKDRLVMLPYSTLFLLRQYFKSYKPKNYLFNGQFDDKYSQRSINQFLQTYAEKAGIKQHIHAHLLRHSFATHALEQGTDIRYVQKLLGHNNIKTTTIYTHVSKKAISNIKSPLDNLNHDFSFR